MYDDVMVFLLEYVEATLTTTVKELNELMRTTLEEELCKGLPSNCYGGQMRCTDVRGLLNKHTHVCKSLEYFLFSYYSLVKGR